MNCPFAVAAALLLLAPHSVSALGCRHLPAPLRSRAAPNDNRIASGTLKDRVHTVSLVIGDVSWSPDGPAGCSLRVRAFAEEGRTAQIPGPLIRITAGTNVRIRVRNSLSTSMWVRGLQARDVSVLDSTEIAPGGTHEFAFRAGAPGAWYYWAGGANARVPVSNENGQLVGALIVDPVDSTGRLPSDRVFVMTRWTPTGTLYNRGFQLNAFNGRSWPQTERLTYAAGDSVRWHVINATDVVHMMHLHGFYYRIVARGDAVHDSALARQNPNTVVSAATRGGEWMSMVWVPERTGNWLFHCHFVSHMSADQRLDRIPIEMRLASSDAPMTRHEGVATAQPNHATMSMGGLLLGVTVTPSRGASTAIRTSTLASAPVRRLQLFANRRERVFGDKPGYGFVVQNGDIAPAPDSLDPGGTPLILTRGEKVSIAVRNRLSTPLSVHWHGIELESYFDGVGGWSGAGQRLAPMIAPGGSFTAEFAPPRSGTFMYHVHNEHGDELASGLYAPLLVLAPGQRFNSDLDRVLIIATGGPGEARGDSTPPLINGTAKPDSLVLRAGVAYRLRLIDISANEVHLVSLSGPSGPVAWRALARDGRDVPSAPASSQPAREITAAGVTRDFEFIPAEQGNYRLSVETVISLRPTGLVTRVPIRVGEP